MAPITKTLALAGALFAVSGVSAPVQKRALVWETVTDVVWTTVDITTTLYPGQPQATTAVVPVTTSSVETHPTSTEEPKVPQVQSTSEAPAPPAPPPAPTTTEAPAPPPTQPTTTAPAPATTTAPSSGGGGSAPSSGYTGACDSSSPCTGDITYYQVATDMSAPSACGGTNTDDEPVIALPVGVMTNNQEYCGKYVTIKHGGTSTQAKVVDKCMGCDNTSIDLSSGLFTKVMGSLGAGRVSGVEWYIN